MAKSNNIYPKMDRNAEDIYKANLFLDELEKQGYLEKSPAAVVYLRKYGNALGINDPKRFSYNFSTKKQQDLAGSYARDFLSSSTITPAGIEAVNENRRRGMINSNFLNLSENSVDRFLEIMDRVGDIINNYSLGSDIVATVAEIANQEESDNSLYDILSNYSETDENVQAALDLFEEEVADYLDKGIELSIGDMNEILLNWLLSI